MGGASNFNCGLAYDYKKKSNSIAILSYLVYKWWILFPNIQGYCMA
jgi:hypothetical protein